MKNVISKITKTLKAVLKHKFTVPVVSLLVGGLLTPISPFLGGLCFGVLGYTAYSIIKDSKK